MPPWRQTQRSRRRQAPAPYYPPTEKKKRAVGCCKHQTIGQHRQNKTRDAYTRRGCLGCVCRQGGKPLRGGVFLIPIYLFFFFFAGAARWRGRTSGPWALCFWPARAVFAFPALRLGKARPSSPKVRKISPATRFGRSAKTLPPSPAGWTHHWLLHCFDSGLLASSPRHLELAVGYHPFTRCNAPGLRGSGSLMRVARCCVCEVSPFTATTDSEGNKLMLPIPR